MEGESKAKALKYLTNQPASVHNYGKLSKSEGSPRSHSSPTSILRKFPHSLRHDQKHRTKLKREETNKRDAKANRCVRSWCVGDEVSDDSEEKPSSEDMGKCHYDGDDDDDDDDDDEGREFETSSDCSNDGDVWKLRAALVNTSKPVHEVTIPRESVRKDPIDESIKKLSVMNNSRNGGDRVIGVAGSRKRTEFPVHKSTPNLVRSVSGSQTTAARSNRHVPLRTSDSLPQLDQTYRIIHSILPRINRTISESHENRKSESHMETIHNRINRSDSVYSKIFNVGNGSQSEEESEGLSLIDSRRSIIVPAAKNRKSRWSYKKTVERMPSLRHLMNRRSRGDTEDSSSTPTPPEVTTSGSCSNLSVPQIRYFDADDDPLPVKKCETVYGLASLTREDSSLQVEPIKPINRLRVPPNGLTGSTSRMCSRCSSLLSMASSSRYSINTTGSGFVNCSSGLDKPPEPNILCKLCLVEVPASLSMEISHCGCVFCKDCMRLYVEFEIQEGAYDISCPDAQCMKQGVVSIGEVEALVMHQMMERYLRFRLNHEVDMDWNRTWCPRAGCETVCNICPREKCAPTSVHCPTCDSDFCSNCKNTWHQGFTCEENSRKLAKEGKSDFMEPGIPFDSDFIKCCPMCNVPIEKDEGCAQMMCKRCKHVFCWYCLASLDDDFLLRHYDKGPCKNKLGHSRASVIWHRTQVIGIFAGLGLLLLVASPLLLLAAPCIVCCKCRVCSGTRLDAEDDLPEESGM